MNIDELANSIIFQCAMIDDAPERLQRIKDMLNAYEAAKFGKPVDCTRPCSYCCNSLAATDELEQYCNVGCKDAAYYKRLLPQAAPVSATEQPAELSDEDIARFVYTSMQWVVRHADNGRHTPSWQEHGNSDAQEEARRCASVISRRILKRESGKPGTHTTGNLKVTPDATIQPSGIVHGEGRIGDD